MRAAFAQRLCDLVTFATDRPNAVEEVKLTCSTDSGVSNQHRLLYDRIFKSKGEPDRLFERDMLFSLGEALDAGLNIFQKWIDFTKTHGAFCTVYFGSMYAEPRYLGEKFQRLMSAFMLLSASISEPMPETVQFAEDVRKAIFAHFTSEERELLAHVFPSPAHAQMTLIMRKLLEENRGLMCPVVEDFDDFVKAASNTLRYFETREELSERLHLGGAKMYYAMQRIRLLIKILVLRQLGFDDRRVTSLIERNSDFVHLVALREKG